MEPPVEGYLEPDLDSMEPEENMVGESEPTLEPYKTLGLSYKEDYYPFSDEVEEDNQTNKKLDPDDPNSPFFKGLVISDEIFEKKEKKIDKLKKIFKRKK